MILHLVFEVASFVDLPEWRWQIYRFTFRKAVFTLCSTGSRIVESDPVYACLLPHTLIISTLCLSGIL